MVWYLHGTCRDHIANYSWQDYIGQTLANKVSGAANEKRVVIYQTAAGREPFSEWLRGLRDTKSRRRILIRLLRLEGGNYGDHRFLNSGVFELRFNFGPGYRMYCAEDGETIVVLLCAGDKSTQVQDIAKASAYWREYLSHA